MTQENSAIKCNNIKNGGLIPLDVQREDRMFCISFKCPACATNVHQTWAFSYEFFPSKNEMQSKLRNDYRILCHKCKAMTFFSFKEDEKAGGIRILAESKSAYNEKIDAPRDFKIRSKKSDTEWLDLMSSLDDSEYNFFQAIEEAEKMIELVTVIESKDGESNGQSVIVENLQAPFWKMLYVHLIVIMETYLYDKLDNLIYKDEEALENFVEHWDPYKKKKLVYNEIVTESRKLKQTVRTDVAEILFHRLPLVEHAFGGAMGQPNIPFFDQSIKDELMPAIKNRHHLVHRNGRDLDGEVVFIGRNQVEQLLDLVKRLSTVTGQKLSMWEAKKGIHGKNGTGSQT